LAILHGFLLNENRVIDNALNLLRYSERTTHQQGVHLNRI